MGLTDHIDCKCKSAAKELDCATGLSDCGLSVAVVGKDEKDVGGLEGTRAGADEPTPFSWSGLGVEQGKRQRCSWHDWLPLLRSPSPTRVNHSYRRYLGIYHLPPTCLCRKLHSLIDV